MTSLEALWTFAAWWAVFAAALFLAFVRPEWKAIREERARIEAEKKSLQGGIS